MDKKDEAVVGENQPEPVELFSTLKQMIKLNSTRYAIRKAFLLKDENGEIYHISYRKFAAHIDYLGTALCQTLGLENKKIAVCGKNCYKWCVSYLAVCGGVGVTVPLDRETVDDELVNIIDFAQISAIIADQKVVSRLLSVYDKLPEGFVIICFDEYDDSRVLSFDSVLSQGRTLVKDGCRSYADKQLDPDELAVLLFTSGTTGMAKGVMLSNRNICADISGTCSVFNVNYNDSTLCVLPLHHAYQAIVFLIVLSIGGCISFSDGLKHIVENLNEYKPTIFVSVPLMLEKMHAKIVAGLSAQGALKKAFTVGKAKALISKITIQDAKKRIFSQVHAVFGGNLRMIIGGGAMFNPDIARDYAAFGLPVVIGYGLTECSPIVICNSSDSPLPDGIGKPIGGAEAMIDNPGEDGVGEILVRGPMVMLGYYNAPEETEKVIKDGWFHTGDLGYVDESGNYHITGRSKNVIVTKNGKNIYPEELEYYLNSDPMVLESLISGDSDTSGDEFVTAQVVPDEQAIKDELQKEKLSKEDIQKAIIEVVRKINRRLPSYKSIKKVSIHEQEFEKTSTQKVKRSSRHNRRRKENEQLVDGENENTVNEADSTDSESESER